MKKLVIGSLVLLAAINVSAQKTTKATTKTTTKTATNKVAAPDFKNLLDSFSYAAGFNVATNMKAQGISRINASLMQKGIDDVFKNKEGALTTEASGACMQKQLEIFANEKGAVEKSAGIAFLEANKKRPGVIVLPNGLQYEVVKSGDPAGIKPAATDTVLVNYAGTTIDGQEFDNSFKRGQPYKTALKDVIRGWTEILQLMRVGDRWKVYIPSDMGYGTSGNGPKIPPHSVLVFDMALEAIVPLARN
ncbi:MAG TPA: FKBP-type peptidyl-prolyl cis-trans isomerase [Ferruginibacter sp.]|nr:FKBP-type peptidyl-prolyl cis-trans isomerase [Ferruginibacter sp.]